jgi:hypothetical protein
MAELEPKLAALSSMTMAQLRAEWERVLKASAPPSFTSDLLAREIAHHLQERVHGRLPSTISRNLQQHVRALEQGRAVTPSIRLKPGTRLSREWRGRTHHVLVEDDGYQYADRRYTSLTAIARDITGVAWSGPRFFGLKSPRVKTSRGAVL